MSYAVIFSAIALGLSAVASLAKFIDWFVHTDPKTMIRTGRWMLLVLAVISLPMLAALLMYQQWSLAMLLGAVMLIVPTILKWRSILGPLRSLFQGELKRARPYDLPEFEPNSPDAQETVQRAAAILEAYLSHAAVERVGDHQQGSSSIEDTMSREEALKILGLKVDATPSEVRGAHRRLVQMMHPDRGGSTYLAAIINHAKDVLLKSAPRKARSPSRTSPGRSKAPPADP
ncbi:hypothetical protein FHS85_003519 [Rhodoligotrophos appendicifer]|uniref:hypothetical protein n=1 Tax=Rhodoligotrophos appendicifer TaxID=987056 RepID=UPI00118547F1|nr:hypothetical protein [Rhodoligotrophos appendicifer]